MDKWEEEFDKKFPHSDGIFYCDEPNNIKSFIRQLLQEYRLDEEEVKDFIKNNPMYSVFAMEYPCSRKSCLDSLAKAICQLKPKVKYNVNKVVDNRSR